MWRLKAWSAAVLLIATTFWIHAEDGIAWKVRGNWRQNRTQTFLQSGDAATPGALLTAESSNDASIIILLPDGQRLLFDCHDAHTCAQGFRIPALIAKPDSDSITLFDNVRRAMHQSAGCMGPPPAATTAETEIVAPLQRDGAILLKHALAALPPGQYRMAVEGGSETKLPEHSLTWSGSQDEAQLPLPHAGVYSLRIFGSLGSERMRVTLLAASPELYPSHHAAFEDAKKDLQEWNETFPGWPMHEWLQLLLRGLAQPQDNKKPSR